jgi:hypothetical protein
MILSDIGHYVKEHQQVTLSQIALHFNAKPDAVRGILDIWVRKGKISRQSATASCGSTCQQCDIASTEIYIWGSAVDESYADQCLNS